jgi:hypothetical protein
MECPRCFLGCILIAYLGGCGSSRPFIKIQTPEHGASISGEIQIAAEVTGKDIARVEFFIDDEFQGLAMHPPYSIPWETYILPDSSLHTIWAKAYDYKDLVAVSDEIRVWVNNIKSKPRNTLHLVSARINGIKLDVSKPVVTVAIGADITGDITVRANNRGDLSWGAPLCGTPNWGDHIGAYWETGIWLPGGASEHTIDLFLQAPEDTGQYYIFFVWGHETDCSHVLSYWQYENSPSWNDGHDVADWTDEQAQMAIDSGYVRSEYQYDASGYGIKYVPAIAIRVKVTTSGP